MRTLLALAAIAAHSDASAFCGTYVGSPGVELINQTSQVIMSRQGARTTLTLANEYEGPASDFAMLIPVPEVLGEDAISTARPELFQRFDDYSAPRVVTYECEDFAWEDGDADADADADSDADADTSAPPDVVVEAQYQVGIYDIVILSAVESGALLTWLDDNGYGITPDAGEILGDYIDAGSFFFAAKVNLDEVPEEASFLEPLQFSYESEAFSLPIRLGTINSPGVQDVVIYVLSPWDGGRVGISNYPELEIEDECMVDVYGAGGVDAHYAGLFEDAWAAQAGAGWLLEYAWRPSGCDPCATTPPTPDELNEAGFSGDTYEAFFSRIRMRYTPEAGTQDITLYQSGIKSFDQIRFIDYNDRMEDRFEVCGVGMVDDPGSCDEEADPGPGGGEEADPGADGEDEWERSPSSEEEKADSASSGCSVAQARHRSMLAVLLVSLIALTGRRRSAA